MSGKVDVLQAKQQKASDTRTVHHEQSGIDGFRIGQFWGATGFERRFGKFKGYIEFRLEFPGGKSAPGIQQSNSAITIFDGKTLQSTSLNGFIGLMF